MSQVQANSQPDQNSEENLQEFNDLLEEVEEIAVLNVPSNRKAAKASDLLGRANVVLRNVCGTDSSCVDAASADINVVRNAASIITGEIGEHGSRSRNYNPELFAAALRTKIRASGWPSIFQFSMFGRGFIPTNSPSMFKCFNPDERPPPKERQKRQKKTEEDHVLTCPESISKAEQMEETSAVLKKIEKIIQREYRDNRNKPLNYFKLVIDPEDFGATVDNIFQVSFLCRDGRISLFHKNGHLWLVPVTKDETSSGGHSEPDFAQHVMTINMKQWSELIKKYDIKKPLINIKDRYLGTQESTKKSTKKK